MKERVWRKRFMEERKKVIGAAIEVIKINRILDLQEGAIKKLRDALKEINPEHPFVKQEEKKEVTTNE